jgi:hypothetical protein
MSLAVLSRPLRFSRLVQIVIVALLAVVCSAPDSWADPIQITNPLAVIGGTVGAPPEVSFSHFSSDIGPGRLSDSTPQTPRGVASAALDWAVSPAQITAKFDALAASPGTLAGGGGALTVQFRVLEPVAFAFAATQSGSGSNFVAASLTSSFPSAFNIFTDFLGTSRAASGGPAPAAFSHAGTLGPGDYFFSARAAADVDAVSSGNVRSSSIAYGIGLTFTPAAPTPEPMSLTLFGMGVVGLVARTRNRKGRGSPACA